MDSDIGRDLSVRVVTILADGETETGTHSAVFHAGGLPSGVYICRLESAGLTFSRKMTLSR
jgi:hypothetical protein